MTQEQLSSIWAATLGLKRVMPDDNFFALGGHSLLGVKLIAAIQEELGPEVELKLTDLFENPTPGEFHAYLTAMAAAGEETGEI